MLRLLDGTELAEDSVLGFITIFTVPDQPVDGVKLTKAWAAEGLDASLIPETRKPVDVFGQACRQVETRRAAGTNGHRIEVKVDRVVNVTAKCIYQVTRMVTDEQKQVIDHPKAMKVTLDKVGAEQGDPDPITVTPLDPSTYHLLQSLAADIVDYYKANQSTVPGTKVRNAIREYMKILGGENLRRKSGGVYFVPKGGGDTLESLERVLDKLYGGDADLHTIPQPNVKAVKDMVAKHHALNVQSEADAMIARLGERLGEYRTNGNKVRSDLLRNVMQERRELGLQRKRYIQLLGGEQKLIQTKLEMLDDQIEHLMQAAQ